MRSLFNYDDISYELSVAVLRIRIS